MGVEAIAAMAGGDVVLEAATGSTGVERDETTGNTSDNSSTGIRMMDKKFVVVALEAAIPFGDGIAEVENEILDGGESLQPWTILRYASQGTYKLSNILTFWERVLCARYDQVLLTTLDFDY